MIILFSYHRWLAYDGYSFLAAYHCLTCNLLCSDMVNKLLSSLLQVDLLYFTYFTLCLSAEHEPITGVWGQSNGLR